MPFVVTIAYKKIGGVPFLINNNVNGFSYLSFKELYNLTVKVISDKNLREKISINAYKTISEIWTAKNAVKNFEILLNSILNEEENPVEEGPASNAYPV